MIVKIDMRERELVKKCEMAVSTTIQFKDLQFVSENLPLGDIIINDGTKDCIIIERKTLNDLASSIKDGRYEEQSYRLNGLNHHNHNIIYLIEGDMYRFNNFKERIDTQTLYSAMVSINYFKGFSVMRSNSIEETALMICNMAYKIGKTKDRVSFYSNLQAADSENNVETNDNANQTNNVEPSEKDYCSVIKKIKKENITPDNIGEIMLCQIPGVSSSSALAILAQFKTLPNLITSIKEDETCLNNVCTIDANGKSRKISKTAIATIVKFLGK
jgi:crossover junction endonuclease MUS81